MTTDDFLPTSTTCIEDLPPEMISELFEYLQLKDLAACSLVNKRWHSIYSNFKVHQLAAYDNYFNSLFISWYDSSRTIREAELCRPWMFYRLAEKPLLSNLKHLALYPWESKFDLNQLNRFQQLIHLEIKGRKFHHRKVHLNLPRLKVLVIRSTNLQTVSIDCPLLSTLVYSYGAQNLSKVKHPETIRKLEIDIVGANWLAPFKNVECLVTWQDQAMSRATLLALPRLRELRYNWEISSVFNNRVFPGPGTVDQMKRKLSHFLDDVEKLRGRDFRFRYAGFPMTKTMLEQIDFGVQVDERTGREYVSDEHIYMKNYHLIDSGALDFVDFVNYSSLLSGVTGEFPRCFWQKFTGIYRVSSNEVPDVDHFLWFLKSLKSLRFLQLHCCEQFSQEFYDQLPVAIPLLSILTLRGNKSRLQLNFDFIAKVPHLFRLEILLPISLDSLHSLSRWLGKFKLCRFHVRSGEERFEVGKMSDSTEWKIKKVRNHRQFDLLFETENPEEILNFFHGGLPKRNVQRSASGYNNCHLI